MIVATVWLAQLAGRNSFANAYKTPGGRRAHSQRNYEPPDGVTPEGKMVKPTYTVPPDSAANVRKALENCGKKYKQIPEPLTGGEDAVTFVFET